MPLHLVLLLSASLAQPKSQNLTAFFIREPTSLLWESTQTFKSSSQLSPLHPPPFYEFSFRSLKSISISKFTHDILTSQLITHLFWLIMWLTLTICSPPFLTNMLHIKLNQVVRNLLILGSYLHCLCSDLLVNILRKSGFILVHPTISNSLALPLTHTTQPLIYPKSL